MKQILNRLFENYTLGRSEAETAMDTITSGGCNHSQMASFITVYKMRQVTVEELEGFRNALLNRCVSLDLSEFQPMDVCGTGGDGKNTFNISTLTAFVLAGAGVRIAKHGNYGVSGPCGSSTVLEYAGVKFTNREEKIKRQMDKSGICFIHAPLFHPALKNVADVRKELGVKTFFNMLGPLINPAQPKRQLVGVYNLELARIYSYLCQQNGNDFLILHSLDGYDEFSLTGDAKFISNRGERLINAGDFNLEKLSETDLSGGMTVEKSFQIFESVLENRSTSAQKNVVCANAALAIHCIYPELQLTDALSVARESLDSGRAKKSFETFLELSQ